MEHLRGALGLIEGSRGLESNRTHWESRVAQTTDQRTDNLLIDQLKIIPDIVSTTGIHTQIQVDLGSVESLKIPV